MDKIQTYKWIRSIMESCYTLKQLDNCMPLIDSFYNRYNLKVERNFLIQYKYELMNKVWCSNSQEMKKYRGY